MANTHRSCDSAQLHKNDPWITHRTNTVTVDAVVIEVRGCSLKSISKISCTNFSNLPASPC